MPSQTQAGPTTLSIGSELPGTISGPPGTGTIVNPSGETTTLIISTTANATSHYHTGTPTNSAVATKTTGPESGVGKVKIGVAVAFAALALAVLGA